MNGISVLAAPLSVLLVAVGCNGVSNQQLGTVAGAAAGAGAGFGLSKVLGGGGLPKHSGPLAVPLLAL